MAIACYCVDASSLVKLKQDFPRKVFPALWQRIEQLVADGRLFAPEEVLREIEHDEVLEAWAKQRRTMFRELDEELLEVSRKVVARFPGLAKPGKFGPAADPFVVAVAFLENEKGPQTLYEEKKDCTVVTEEGGGPQQIPAACSAFGVKCISLVELFKTEEWVFE